MTIHWFILRNHRKRNHPFNHLILSIISIILTSSVTLCQPSSSTYWMIQPLLAVFTSFRKIVSWWLPAWQPLRCAAKNGHWVEGKGTGNAWFWPSKQMQTNSRIWWYLMFFGDECVWNNGDHECNQSELMTRSSWGWCTTSFTVTAIGSNHVWTKHYFNTSTYCVELSE